jgi:hypothetical protein
MPVNIQSDLSEASTHPEVSAARVSSVPLPASSPRALAGAEAPAWSLQEAAVPAYSLREEACAAVVAADVRAAQAVAVAEPEPVGSGSAPDGSARDDCSAVPQPVGYCAAVAQADSSGDEAAQADCSAELAGYLAVPRAADSPRDDYSVGSSRDDCSVVPPGGDSPRGDYSVDSSRDDCWVDSARDDYSVVPRAADSARGGYSVDSSRDDCLAVPQVADSSPGDCSAATALDSADFPADLPVG